MLALFVYRTVTFYFLLITVVWGLICLFPRAATTVVVKNFFTLQQAPDLMTEDGHSVIEGSLAVKLAGPFAPGQFAQAGQLSQVPGMPSIGTVEKLAGTVTLTRSDGTVVQASKGSAVFTGDIIKTEADANIGIKFVDDTNFALGESGRMVIDEMIYDPSNNSNSSSSFSVVQGVFSFVSARLRRLVTTRWLLTRLSPRLAFEGRRLRVRLRLRVIELDHAVA